MSRASRKRKLESIVLSDSEEERTETSLSQSTALRQPLHFSQSNRPPPVPRSNTAQPATSQISLQQESKLLVGSHVPKSSADLAVQKKKVGEVRDWLLADYGPSLLLLSGPSGCGKTSTVRVLAAENGIELTEWTTPTPTLWAEHVQQRAAGISGTYTSKLDDFEDFVSHAKLGVLPLRTANATEPAGNKDQIYRACQGSFDGGKQYGGRPISSQQPCVPAKKLLLIEDLPNFADAQQRQRLADLLGSIAGVAKCRVVITATVSTSQGGQDRASAASANQGLHKELLAAMNAAGAAHISFNPVTKAHMDKALQQACAESGIQLPGDVVTGIADSASGDLRNGLQTLQLAAVGLPLEGKGIKTSKAKAKRGKKSKAEAAVPVATATSGSTVSSGKDTGLALFHALGKILYNKRPDAAEGIADADSVAGAGVEDCLLPLSSAALQMRSSRNKPCEVADRHKRPKLGADPEAVLLKSGLESSTAAAFLHENMLEFVNHDAVEDAAGACSYLSDAARMLDQSSGHQPDWNNDNAFDGHSLTEAAAGSTVMRGLLYSLMHPAARRFLSLKSPALFTINKAAGLNKEQLQAMCWTAHSMTGSARVVATDNLPFVRCMAAMSSNQALKASLPELWTHVHNGDFVSQRMQGQPFAGGPPLDVAAGKAAMSGLSLAHELSDDAIESE
ncbi:hypothetical protein WJX77_005220 [Trebouxia sp. C0004]